MEKNNTKSFVAFTLAEVLITLGILGVLAEMLIPDLIQNTQNQVYKATYKNAFSDWNQAFESASMNNELVARTALDYDPPNDIANFNAIKSHFEVVKDYTGTGDISECWPKPASEQYIYWGAPYSGAPCFIDKQGRAWALWMEAANHSYPHVFVDTNGPNNGPNFMGRDRWVFDAVAFDDNQYMTKKFQAGADYTSSTQQWQTFICPHLSCYFSSWLYQ